MTVSEDMRNRVLFALNDYWRRNHMAPSYRELAEIVGCNSTSVMRVALRELAETGVVRLSGSGKARSAIPAWVDKLFNDAICVHRVTDGVWALVMNNVVSDDYESPGEARSAGWRRLFKER